MKLSIAWLAAAWLHPCLAEISSSTNRDYDKYDYYAVKLDTLHTPHELAEHVGFEYVGPWVVHDDVHVFQAPLHTDDLIQAKLGELEVERLQKRGMGHHVLDSLRYGQKQIRRQRLVKRSAIPHVLHKRADAAVEAAIAERNTIAKTLNIQDPIFNEQWHLFNTPKPGNDLNVTGVWLQGITGKNATVCIVDDGLDFNSEDLKDNYFAAGSFDFNDKGPDPKPRLSDDTHGTRCAGEVAAGKNNACGVGIAYDARISAVRILSAPISDLDEAEAVIYGIQENDIYSCSWGPPDDGITMDAPTLVIQKAMQKAILEGRGGKGTIYVFAAGNGAAVEDNCNFDGYTNSIFSATIGAIDRSNHHPYYSERCSAQLAVTYSSGDGDNIHTTDVGANKCTGQHGGTSAAGPIVAGVYALVIGLRPDLGWRDMQWLTLLSAHPFFDGQDSTEWQTTAAGRKYSHQFGYGRVDAYAIVELAKTWKNVKKQAWYFSPVIEVQHAIPEGDQGLASTFDITADMLKQANLKRIEHVTVTMNVAHGRRGDISVDLISPYGMVSHLSETRKLDQNTGGYVDWTFMSVAHFGEAGIGTWKLIIRDTVANTNTGQMLDWRLKLFGESIDDSNQRLLPYPDEQDATSTIAASMIHTTSVMPATTSSAAVIPTSLPTRPSVARPTDGSSNDSDSSSAEAEQSTGATQAVPTNTAQPTSQPGQVSDDKEQSDKPNAGESSGKSESNFLPGLFPTFGVSKRTQVWIYGSLALILVFCVSLAGYTYWQRRKRLMNDPRDVYEFDMLEDQEETDGMLGGGRNSAVGKRGRRRRAGELYDAFAGESDESDGEIFSEEEEGAGARLSEKRGEKHAGYKDEDET
jgi:kexin